MGWARVGDPSGTASADPSAGDPSTRAAPLSVIWSLLGRHIAFHPRLVELTGSVKAALLLSQSIYWTRRGRDIVQNGGWFYKTTEQWTRETGLSPTEQGSARDALKGLALVEERRMGIPARLHFRLNTERLGNWLSERIAVRQIGADWSDSVMVAEMLGPAVAYHRALAGISGGVHAALMLSRALYLTRLQAKRELDAWICNSAAQWSEEIGLTRREQEIARRNLARAGVWEETLRGIPASLFARIRLDRLLSLLRQSSPAPADSAARTVCQVCEEATDRFAQKGESSMWHSHILDSSKPPYLIGRNRHHCTEESANLLIEFSTCESVQPQHTVRQANAQDTGDDGVDAAGGGGGDLIFPNRMHPQECAAARVLLRPCADQAQALLDELAGRLQVHGVRGSPVAYLRGLIAREHAGTFIAELGLPIAAERRQRQLAAEQRSACEAEERCQAAQRATPEYQARVRAQRERLSQLRADMTQRMAAGRPR